MRADKAGPVMPRPREVWDILAFEHPLSGLQLVEAGIGVGAP
jgi:hypothetical protein